MPFGDIIREVAVDSNGATAVSGTFAGALTTGNLVVAVAFSGDGPLTAANDITEDVDHTDAGSDDGFSGGHWVVTADNRTQGFTQPNSDQFALILREYEGPWEASPFDQSGTTAFANSTANPQDKLIAAGGATSQDDELVVVAYSLRDTSSGETYVASAPTESFINLLQEDNQAGAFQKSVITADKVLSAIGTPNTQITITRTGGGDPWRSGALLMTFKKAAGGGGSAPRIIPSRHLATLGAG